MTALDAKPPVESAPALRDVRPPGERYYRHPGDVLRLILWAAVTAVLVIFIEVATASSSGVTDDLGRAASRISQSIRELSLALVQVAAVIVPVLILVILGLGQRWRRLGVVLLAAAAGAALLQVLDTLFDLSNRLPGAVDTGTWVASASFPSLAYVAGAAAAATVGKPWLTRPWRRAADVSLIVLVVMMAIAGTAGLPELLVAVAAGGAIGAAVLVLFGAPNRRAAPATVAASLRAAGLDVVDLVTQRAEGGRSQLYTAMTADGGRVFVKVYGRDSRSADLLYRGYRAIVLRSANDEWPSPSLKHDVEHEAFLYLLARDAGVACPNIHALTTLPDASVALALDYIDGGRLDEMTADAIDDARLDATWREVTALHARGLAHRSLRAANVLVAERPVIIDFGFAQESATPRAQAIDRAELLASLAALVGPERAVASAARVLDPEALATALPYLQPLALSAATRKQASKSNLEELRAAITEATGVEPVKLERLIRVRPRTLLTIALLVGAFYVLLPQLAQAGDAFGELGSANFWWLLVAVVFSFLTYVASAIGLRGGVPERVPLPPTIEAAFASSFVNRVTPANVGGMALNVRYLSKAGSDPAAAVTGVGLNSLAGGVVHAVLLIVFFSWAGKDGSSAFKLPSSSRLLVIIAVVLAVAGVVIATRRGRKLFRKHVVGFLQRSLASLVTLARSPAKLAALFGGSAGVTLSYIAALAAAVAAFHGDVTIAQVGAVYLGSSILAAAAPTPGGLGAMEAALVAGFTGVGLDPGVAVAAVLSYRLCTYWLPILPGWACFQHLQRRDFI